MSIARETKINESSLVSINNVENVIVKFLVACGDDFLYMWSGETRQSSCWKNRDSIWNSTPIHGQEQATIWNLSWCFY